MIILINLSFVGIVAFLILFQSPYVLSKSQSEIDFSSIFKITKSEMHFSQGRNCNFITCMGEIRNLTSDVWENLVVEVKYFDSNEVLIDTETEHLYENVLRGKDTTSFRIRVPADREATEYVNHASRITWAEKRQSYVPSKKTKKKSSNWFNVFLSWMPMLLLIAVWIFYMRKMRSPQNKTIDFLKNQNEISRKNNEIMERIALSLETLSEKK